MSSFFSKWTAVGRDRPLAAAVDDGGRHSVKPDGYQVCVLLPDTKSSVRWVQFDAPDFAEGTQDGRRHLHRSPTR